MNHLTGVIINGVGILVGSGLGMLWGHKLHSGFREQAMRLVGMVVILIGFKMAWPLNDPVNTLLSLVIGGWIGWFLGINDGLEKFGHWAESKARRTGFSKGFIAASLIFNVGPMAILGALQEGLTGRYSILATKAVLDGTTSLLLTTAAGWGVVVAAVPTVVYEGVLSLLAGDLSHALQGPLLQDVTVVGGFIIAGIGFNFFLDRAVLKIGDLLPALVVSLALGWLKTHGVFFL
jgi:uncharacterized membrane protein YqgA involved in biofilm formation